GDLDDVLRWGTYRPNLYFGTRPRVPQSLLSGLMWFGLDDQQNWQRIRHACEVGDNLSEYGYVRHNGRDFGEQTMRDEAHGVEIRSTFVKPAGHGSWAVRFTGRTLADNAQGVSLAYYFGLEGNGTMSMAVADGAVRISGRTPELGRFKIRIVPAASNQSPPLPPGVAADASPAKRIAGVAVAVPGESVWKARDVFQERIISHAQARARDIMRHSGGKGAANGRVLFALDSDGARRKGRNLVFAQMLVHGEFAFDVIYDDLSAAAPIDVAAIDDAAAAHRAAFDARFDAVFALRGKGYGDAEIAIARRALSSLIGGIGYFYGRGLVAAGPMPGPGDDANVPPAELSAPYALFATTPSRPFFPRGFLWDEGFHQLLLARWDADLSLDIVRSWFSTMDASGWIAREQILGDEARSKVPAEFQVQYPNFANPPTLLFAVRALAERTAANELSGLAEQLEQVYCERDVPDPATSQTLTLPRIAELHRFSSRLLDYFMATQAGARGRGYRWRGRTEGHTLTSGLDDYPRARPPSSGELHVDLFAWVTYMLAVDTELAAHDSGGGRAANQTA
ncbi:Processing alpha glucosidase I, partial [Coemansia nantahalensis]